MKESQAQIIRPARELVTEFTRTEEQQRESESSLAEDRTWLGWLMSKDALFGISLFLVALALTLVRRPDAFYFPQFYAEDGVIWYREAYHHGWFEALLRSQDGYFQTLARIGGALSLLVPMKHAPAVFNWMALLVQMLPVLLIASGRLNNLFPGAWSRVLVVLFYVAIPNTDDLHVNLTTAQWRLTLLIALLLAARPAVSRLARYSDYFFAALSSVSGPYSLFLGPLGLVLALRSKEKHRFRLAAILLAGACIQAVTLLFFSTHTRPQIELGASVLAFCRVFSGQLVLGLLFGETGFKFLYQYEFWGAALPIVLTAVSLFIIAYCFFRSSDEMRFLILFASAIFLSALLSPTVSGERPAWNMLEGPNATTRYWLIPSFIFFLCLLEVVRRFPKGFAAKLAVTFLVLMPIGISLDFQYEKWEREKFRRAWRRFKRAHAGERVAVPIHPPGYTMYLDKR